MNETKPGLIFEKISAVMAEIEAIAKNRDNTQQKFKFRGIDDVYNAIHDAMAKHKIFTVPEVLNRQYKEKQTNSGGLIMERILTIRYRFYAEDGSFIDAVVDGEAMDTGDKATSKCMAIAHKYVLLQIFCIPTEDIKEVGAKDPDETSYEVVVGDSNRPIIKPIAPVQPKNADLSHSNSSPIKPQDRPALQELVKTMKRAKFEDMVKEQLTIMKIPSMKDLSDQQCKDLTKWILDLAMASPSEPDNWMV